MQHSACAAKHAANSPSRLAAWTLEVALGQDRSYRKALNGIEEDVDLRTRCDEVTTQLQRAKNHDEYSQTARCSKRSRSTASRKVKHRRHRPRTPRVHQDLDLPTLLFLILCLHLQLILKKGIFCDCQLFFIILFMLCSCLLCFAVYCFHLTCSVHFTWQSPQISQTIVLWRPPEKHKKQAHAPCARARRPQKETRTLLKQKGHPGAPCGAFDKTIFVSTEACGAGGLLNAIGKMRSEAVSVTPQSSRGEKNMQC